MLRVLSVCVVALHVVHCAPKLRIFEEQIPANLLTLPSNATSIRANIEDSFNCEGRPYGYYADVGNDCQLFHVCLPVTYANGRSQTFRWSFICPDETVFNQEMFTCTRSDEAMDCADSPRFYNLNINFGEHLNIALLNDEEPQTTEQQQEYVKTTLPIVPIYHRRTMKI